MSELLTIAELIAPGKPLAEGKLLAGTAGLDNGVTWAVSLRPYAPAIPPLKGGEISLTGSDVLARHEPPITLADVVRQLHLRGASGLVVRGEVNEQAIEEAERVGLPLVHLPDEVALHDIEQEIMRECALVQARREIMAGEEPGGWIVRLLAGHIATIIEAQAPARREGHDLAASYAVALVVPVGGKDRSDHHLHEAAASLAKRGGSNGSGFIVHPYEDGLAVLVPSDSEKLLGSALSGRGLACGIGKVRPILEAPSSLHEARLALLSSIMLHEGRAVRFESLGAERMLLLLYVDNKVELERFVQETLGPLLAHDARSAMPLLPTIASFVGHGGRLRETAVELFVHRNTLAYRLDNASQLLGIDLKNADARLAVEMALRALPLVRTAERS
jgi:purine catabolism regulator